MTENTQTGTLHLVRSHRSSSGRFAGPLAATVLGLALLLGTSLAPSSAAAQSTEALVADTNLTYETDGTIDDTSTRFIYFSTFFFYDAQGSLITSEYVGTIYASNGEIYVEFDMDSDDWDDVKNDTTAVELEGWSHFNEWDATATGAKVKLYDVDDVFTGVFEPDPWNG